MECLSVRGLHWLDLHLRWTPEKRLLAGRHVLKDHMSGPVMIQRSV